MTDDEVDTLFEDIVRNKMTERQYNAWKCSWWDGGDMDDEDIIHYALDWDRDLKVLTIQSFKPAKGVKHD